MFPLRLALQSIYKEKWVNILSMLSIGIVLFILAFVFAAVYNMDRMTSMLPDKLSVMIFLRETATPEDVGNLERMLRSDPVVKNATFISRDKALEQLRSLFKSDDFILTGLSENPLFDSYDVKLKHAKTDIQSVRNFVERLKGVKAVDSVEYGQDFLDTVMMLKNGARLLGTTTGSIFAVAVIFICYSTVSILFYRYREEIEIYKLLGATKRFIRAPFFIEGSLIGLAGGILGALFLYCLYYYLIKDMIAVVPIISFITLPSLSFAALPLCGCVLGFAGAAIAVGRLKY